MRKRLPALCLLALAALAGRAPAAKPPDLPDNPPIIVAPTPCLPPSAWLDASPSIFPPAPPETEYEVTLTPAGERSLVAALLLNAHPFVAFLPVEPCVAQGCPHQPADRRCVADPALTRTVLENLEALEKAAAHLGEAEKLVRKGEMVAALAALEEAQRLVPGSPCAQRAEGMAKAVCAAKTRPGECEEAEGGIALDWGFPGFVRQFGMCQVNGLCEKVTDHAGSPLARPITLHCVNTPLGVVLQNLRDVCGVNVVVDARVCLQRPVCVHAQGTPARAVVEMVVRPLGYEPCVCGDVVRVCPAGQPSCKKGGEECCEEDGRRDTKCCAKEGCCALGCCKGAAAAKKCGPACPKCQVPHVKRDGDVEEMVTQLMKVCYLAIEQEQYGVAADLARQARALDPVRVEGDPVLYKFSLLGECGAQKPCPQSCPGAGRPSNNYPARKAPEDDDLSLRPKRPGTVKTLDAVVVSNDVGERPCGKCVKVAVKVKETRAGSVLYGVGVNSDAGLAGTVVLNERNFDCCQGSVFTKVIRKHGWQWAKVGADVLTKLYVAEPIPDDSREGCLTLGLSSSGAISVYCRTAHEGTVYNATLKDGFFVMWTKPAKGEKAE